MFILFRGLALSVVRVFLLFCYSVVSKAHNVLLKLLQSEKCAVKRSRHAVRSPSPDKGEYEGRPQKGVYYDVEEGSLRPMRRLIVGRGNEIAFGTRADRALASDGYYVGAYGQLICDESFGLIAQLGGGAFSTVWLALDIKGVTNSAMSPMVLSYRSDSTRYNSSSVMMSPGRAFVVLKISRSLPSYCRACEREFETHQELYVRLQRSGFNLSKLLIHSMLLYEEAPRSSHVVQVGDPCGPSLLEFVMNCNPNRGVRNRSWRLRFIKQITRHVAEGLGQLHSCGVVHTDVKPENILLRLPSPQVLHLMRQGVGSGSFENPLFAVDREAILARYRFEVINNKEMWEDLRSGRVECDKDMFSAVEDSDIITMISDLRIADLGNAVLLERIVDEPHVSSEQRGGGGSPSSLLHVAAAAHAFQTREYRAPEICLGVTPLRAALSGAMDVWSLGCVVFELITGRYLLNPRSSLKSKGITLSPSTPPTTSTSSPLVVSFGRSASALIEDELNLAHLAMIQEVCGGPPPHSLLKGCDFDQFPKLASDTLVGRGLVEFLIKQGLFNGEAQSPSDVDEMEIQLIVDWLVAIFQWDPASRPTMQDLLAHSWLASPC